MRKPQRFGFQDAPSFSSSSIKGEDTGGGDERRRPLTLALSHKGRGNLKLRSRSKS